MAISEWQILFNKIKHDIGSPFGVITFNKLIEPSSYFDEIMNSYAKACFLYMKTSQVRHSI
ncbi:hypothetical protein BZK21_04210 [Helicobacter pylori]|nr:hypothetical protein BZK21_04210 [Helicobacter pylori]